MSTSNRNTTMIGGALAAAAMVGSVLGPATAHAEPQGYIQDEYEVGLVYGTFNESPNPNLTLLVGGTVEEFCPADPGTAPMRVFLRNDGTVDLKVNDKDQPIYLYEQSVGDSFDWIDAVCAAARRQLGRGGALRERYGRPQGPNQHHQRRRGRHIQLGERQADCE